MCNKGITVDIWNDIQLTDVIMFKGVPNSSFNTKNVYLYIWTLKRIVEWKFILQLCALWCENCEHSTIDISIYFLWSIEIFSLHYSSQLRILMVAFYTRWNFARNDMVVVVYSVITGGLFTFYFKRSGVSMYFKFQYTMSFLWAKNVLAIVTGDRHYLTRILILWFFVS